MPETTTQGVKRSSSDTQETTKKQRSMEEGSIKSLDEKRIILKGLNSIDNTSLTGEEDESKIIALCNVSKSTYGNTAAVCVYKEWIKTCAKELEGTTVDIATVINFPKGDCGITESGMKTLVSETEEAIKDGAIEIDLVINYSKLKEDPESGAEEAQKLVRGIKDVCGKNVLLKVIIEAGELQTEALVKAATRAAVKGGCDMVKTSTGKVPVNATPENVTWICEELAELKKIENVDYSHVGVKVAGGVKTVEDLKEYLGIMEETLGYNMIAKPTFRIGASSLCKVLHDKLKEVADEE